MIAGMRPFGLICRNQDSFCSRWARSRRASCSRATTLLARSRSCVRWGWRPCRDRSCLSYPSLKFEIRRSRQRPIKRPAPSPSRRKSTTNRGEAAGSQIALHSLHLRAEKLRLLSLRRLRRSLESSECASEMIVDTMVKLSGLTFIVSITLFDLQRATGSLQGSPRRIAGARSRRSRCRRRGAITSSRTIFSSTPS